MIEARPLGRASMFLHRLLLLHGARVCPDVALVIPGINAAIVFNGVYRYAGSRDKRGKLCPGVAAGIVRKEVAGIIVK